MDFLQPLAAIGLVLALLAAVLFLLKQRGGWTFRAPGATTSAGTRRLEVLERVTLGPQHSLHLVRAGDRTVLIATAPGGCHIVDVASASKGERI